MTQQDILAAEYALGLLDSAEALRARGLMATDPGFAAAVADWEDRLAPILDTIPAITPADDIWPRIMAALDEAQPVVEVLALRRTLRRWQMATGISAAAAVTLALLALPLMQPPAPAPIPAPVPAPQSATLAAAAPLVASIPIPDTPLRIGLTYLPDREEMLVSASGITADGVHDHELWLVMPDEGAKSLGVVEAGAERRMTLDHAVAMQIHEGAKLLLTREPLGGAKPGSDAGPVVANGIFQAT